MIRIVAAALAGLPFFAVAQETAPAAGAPDAPVALAPPAAIPVTAPALERSGVYMGFGAGASDSGEVGDGGPVYRIRLGVARSPRLLFGFEGGHSRDGAMSLSYYDVGATFFPWRKLFFLRGGVGISSAAHDGIAEQGANALLGLGLAIGGVKGFNVTLNLETVSHRLSGGTRGYEHNVGNPSAWIGLEWL
jgi:hypothetical protein